MSALQPPEDAKLRKAQGENLSETCPVCRAGRGNRHACQFGEVLRTPISPFFCTEREEHQNSTDGTRWAKFPSSHLKTGASSVAPLGCFAVPLAVRFTLFYSSLASPRRSSS